MPRTLKHLIALLIALCALPAAAQAATVPLYAAAKTTGTAHIYKQQSTVDLGYVRVPMAGYIDTTGPLDQRLVRLGKDGRITYADSSSADFSQLKAQGWQVVSVIGFTLPPGTPNTLPTFRLEHANGDVLLTGDTVERDRLLTQGYTQTGTLGNLTQRRCVPFVANNTAVETGPAPLPYEAGWENGDWSRFRAVYSVPCTPENGVQIVTAPRLPGHNYAARFPINPAATPLGWGERAMVTLSDLQQGAAVMPDNTGHGVPSRSMKGVERWYGFSYLFGPDFQVHNTAPSNTGSVLLMAWHHTGDAFNPETPCNDPAFIAARVMPDATIKLRLRMSGGKPRVIPNSCESYETEVYDDFADLDAVRNQWQNFTVHAKWCFDDNCAVNGLFELWDNGVKVAEVHGPNMYKDERAGMQGGIYRPAKWSVSSELTMGHWRMGSSYAAVQP